jgi:hypothetical protein
MATPQMHVTTFSERVGPVHAANIQAALEEGMCKIYQACTCASKSSKCQCATQVQRVAENLRSLVEAIVIFNINTSTRGLMCDFRETMLDAHYKEDKSAIATMNNTIEKLAVHVRSWPDHTAFAKLTESTLAAIRDPLAPTQKRTKTTHLFATA